MSPQTQTQHPKPARALPAILSAIALAAGILCTGGVSADSHWVAFGDSLTKGWPYWPENLRGARGGAYPSQLERLVATNHPEALVQIHNWGEGGETTHQSVGRLSAVLASTRPSHVLIMIGTNDLWTGISPHTTAANIGSMIGIAKRSNVVPVVSNLTPSTYPGHGGSRIGPFYNPRIEQAVTSRDVTLVDAYAAFAPQWSTLTSDGLHMNLAGYSLLAETFCARIEECAPTPVVPTPVAMPWMDLLLEDGDEINESLISNPGTDPDSANPTDESQSGDANSSS